MYYFLGNLSIFDLSFSLTTVPKMLSYLSGHSQGISFQGCAAQLFFYHFLGCTEAFLYTVMAYDRFVAICYPLRYMVIMNHRVCSVLATGTWMSGCVHAIILTSLTFQLPYCGSNQVAYYFCDIPAVLPLACKDTSLAQRPNPSPLLGVVIQMLNNLVTPMLNRLIYSLRNKDVKSAPRHVFLNRNLALRNE
ncbi:Putative olfactory receptor 10D4 [Heterocephalus glaber]|uniref:Putative olfactory receptor 10D4 n=1 Tax=Heterocephalus glaber TaxID=10181 RepID=G5C588_HETGA|nr:Putative olfactory receptor 10D4 [Heterocephalus glaber]